MEECKKNINYRTPNDTVVERKTCCTSDKLQKNTTISKEEDDIISLILRRVPTNRLLNELVCREGADEWMVNAEDSYNIRIARISQEEFSSHSNLGPARIVIIRKMLPDM